MQYLRTFLIGIALAGAPILAGCDRTISHDEQTKTDANGNVVKHDETTVKESDQGDVTKTESHSTDKP